MNLFEDCLLKKWEIATLKSLLRWDGNGQRNSGTSQRERKKGDGDRLEEHCDEMARRERIGFESK